jgi:hypothetical protein
MGRSNIWICLDDTPFSILFSLQPFFQALGIVVALLWMRLSEGLAWGSHNKVDVIVLTETLAEPSAHVDDF